MVLRMNEALRLELGNCKKAFPANLTKKLSEYLHQKEGICPEELRERLGGQSRFKPDCLQWKSTLSTCLLRFRSSSPREWPPTTLVIATLEFRTTQKGHGLDFCTFLALAGRSCGYQYLGFENLREDFVPIVEKYGFQPTPQSWLLASECTALAHREDNDECSPFPQRYSVPANWYAPVEALIVSC